MIQLYYFTWIGWHLVIYTTAHDMASTAQQSTVLLYKWKHCVVQYSNQATTKVLYCFYDSVRKNFGQLLYCSNWLLWLVDYKRWRNTISK